jgi:hypothetical protein
MKVYIYEGKGPQGTWNNTKQGIQAKEREISKADAKPNHCIGGKPRPVRIGHVTQQQ